MKRFEGRDVIRKFVGGTGPKVFDRPGSRQLHLQSNFLIDEVTETTAKTKNYMIWSMQLSGPDIRDEMGPTMLSHGYYLDDWGFDDVAGAGSWRGHLDRGGITGSVAFGGTYANTGSLRAASIARATGFLGGVGNSVYNGGLSGSGNSRGRVICTHFFRRGMLERDLWRADLEFTNRKLSSTTVRGYQHWAIPYVRLMRKSPLAERIMYPLAKARAEEIGYQVGIRSKGSIGGKLVRLVGEWSGPTCCCSRGTASEARRRSYPSHVELRQP
ncbi:hypothetical protein QO004_003118 [Rhizobium mesoamericanum]|uniref:hypothetical protein n=1 Tax=Rhizobium mesoamericanum TaxID=1079800 RepID=UPI00277ED77A|nr:hypothetical protein [Rhizobium mesoamericanum]MDQ0561325.1 hypothetical protein [Rhizobium mesoamericanum]